MQNLLIITYIPSPYQVEFFNAIALSTKFNLKVAYLQSSCDAPIAAQWQQPEIQHEHLFLNQKSDFEQLEQEVDASDLVVFNYYRHPRLSQLMDRCLEFNKPWCFWGERPGFKHAGFLGWLYRRWKLATLHESSAPIWGIGIWGVEQYRREFTISRNYFDLPYFSDLSRFANSNRSYNQEKRIFLYSGALIERKGVDLLASAFSKLASQFDNIELHLVGDGELRPSLEKQLAPHEKQVKFHGFQPWDKLPHYYQQADILCVPSRHDGWGMVIPEGLAAGLPVIGTDSTGAAIELIRDSHNGWLVDADSEASLHEAMHQAIKLSTTELANYSQAARERAANHSLDHGVQRFEQTAIETIRLFSPTNSQEGITAQKLVTNMRSGIL
ncbi:MAG: glycosyltransferase family 4 protein [Cyanobacteria bacterium J06631_2]